MADTTPKWIKYGLNIVFWIPLIGSLFGPWYCPILLALMWAIGIASYGYQQKIGIKKAFKWFGNRIDDPWDWIKEKIHCGKIPFTNKCMNIAFMMKNRGKPYWPIIRNCPEVHQYENCDPEDKGEIE